MPPILLPPPLVPLPIFPIDANETTTMEVPTTTLFDEVSGLNRFLADLPTSLSDVSFLVLI